MTRRESILAFLLSPLAWARTVKRPVLTSGNALIVKGHGPFLGGGKPGEVICMSGGQLTYGPLNLANPDAMTGSIASCDGSIVVPGQAIQVGVIGPEHHGSQALA